jgi:hypothetical protein
VLFADNFGTWFDQQAHESFNPAAVPESSLLKVSEVQGCGDLFNRISDSADILLGGPET